MPYSVGLKWYNTGTVTVTQGSTTLTGVGTNWVNGGIKPGDIFTVDNSVLYQVNTVNSNTSITLATAFTGTSGSTLNYSIIRNFAATMQAEIAAQVALLVNKYETYIDTDLNQIVGPKGDPGIAYRGVWASGRTYNALDAVDYNGTLYLAKQPHTSSSYNSPAAAGSLWMDMEITIPPIVNELTGSGSGLHNSLYRGKALGSTFTAAQQNAIDDGSFEELFVGDHWDFSNVSYTWTDDEGQTHNDVYSGTFRIADCDYYRRSGDNVVLTKHHLIVVPDACMFYRGMNATNTTEGAYAGSEMRTKPSGLARAKAIAEACFGAGTLLSHRQYFENAVTNGRPSAGAWYDSEGDELMTEEQVYGAPIFDSGSPDGVTVPYRYTIGCKQFSLFRHRPDLISNRQYFWLQNVVSAARFADVNVGGTCDTSGASNAYGVRPAIALRKAAA